ncbi:MAG TPA: cystathionine beta-lyase [Caulobacteraceae bacterium]|nr:cystathionine beta-lyase [Caulobacteraceae bacterium]
MSEEKREATRLVRAGAKPRPLHRTVAPPIQRGSTVLLPDAASLYDHDQVTYGRAGLGVHEALAEAMCALEGAKHARLFPSGLAAVTAAATSVLRAGDEVLVCDSVYAPVRRYFDKVMARFRVKVTYYPPRATPEAVLAAGGAALRLIVLESPGSLTYEIADAPAIAALARARGVYTLIDNTWAAGLLLKPLALGVDMSAQALTKYVCGHSDVFLGAAVTNDAGLAHGLDEAVWNFGWSVSPDDAYQGLRGLRTLKTRLERHAAHAAVVAEWLAARPEVAEVVYPPLPSSKDHALWARDFSGANGLLSIVLGGASDAAVDAFLDRLELFGLGFSWGGFESLAISSGDQFARRRFPPAFAGPLVRLHVGLEDPYDLIADLERGLDALRARDAKG